MAESKPRIRLSIAIIPVIFLVLALFTGIVILKQTPHISLILSAAVAAGIATANGYTWKSIQEGMVHGISLTLGSIMILVVVGAMIGTWIIGGVVPTMIFYGLKVLTPGIFLAATMVICSIVALGTGSSWSTAGTVGVALIGVGQGLGIPTPMVGGAIISGAYFGDKMSPLSDTTNLAPAVSGTDLFTHIRHMVYTTVPAFLVALVLYSLLGLKFAGGEIDPLKIQTILDTLQSNFSIHPVLLLPPVFVIIMVIKKIPPLPALLGGAALGGILAGVMQHAPVAAIFDTAQNGYVSQTGVAMVDDLLTRGGIMSMMETISLIICALSFGGIMEKTGMLEVIAAALLKHVKRDGTLIATTIFSCIGMNVIASDQYMAIVIPGRMYRKAFKKRGIHAKNLSRALEDSGTLSSPLIPWNSCGAFMHGTLGINPLLYLPWAFLNLLTPIISMVYGYTGITIHKDNTAPVLNDETAIK